MKHLRITVEGKTYEVEVETIGEADTVAAAPVRPQPVRRAAPAVVAVPAPAAPKPAATAAPATAGANDLASPLSALVVSIDVSLGQVVAAGDRVVTLEAMKMNTIVNAQKAGKVTAVHVANGDAVEEGQPLLTIE